MDGQKSDFSPSFSLQMMPEKNICLAREACAKNSDAQTRFPLFKSDPSLAQQCYVIVKGGKVGGSPLLARTESKIGITFGLAAKEITTPFFKKSCAQVASSVTPPVTPNVSQTVVPHSAGRRPIPHQRQSSCTRSLRLRHEEMILIERKAKTLDMSVNAFIRAKALGEDYIEKPPTWLRDALLKLYVEMSRQGNNLNQIARNVNKGFLSGEEALAEANLQRTTMFRLMEKLELALSGRRPPDDY